MQKCSHTAAQVAGGMLGECRSIHARAGDNALGHPQLHTTGHPSGRLPGGDAKTPGPNSSVGCVTCHFAVYPESSHVVEEGGDW